MYRCCRKFTWHPFEEESVKSSSLNFVTEEFVSEYVQALFAVQM